MPARMVTSPFPVTERVLLVDATGLLVRCGHAGRGTGMKSGGWSTGPLHLFIISAARLISERQPDYAVMCWDGRGAVGWRRAIWPGYKAGRRVPGAAWDDRELAMRFLEAAGLCSLSYDGYEADDAVAASWRTFRAALPEAAVVIASDDADMHQLLEEGTRQVSLTGLEEPWTYQRVVSHYGCEPGQLPLLRALAGDKSDGVPGAPGVGLKRGLAALTAADWDLARVMKAAFRLPVASWTDPALLEKFRQVLDLRNPPRALDADDAWSRSDLPNRCGWPPPPDDEALVRFLERFEMKTILESLRAGTLWQS